MKENRNKLSYLKKYSKQLQLGKIYYNLFAMPKGLIEKSYKRGFLNYYSDYRERRRMEDAVYSLPILNMNNNGNPLKIYFLTGEKYWYQSCFCAYSFINNVEEDIKPYFYDDGTLVKKYIDEIKRIFPTCKIINKDKIEKDLDCFLPENEFPYLRYFRIEKPLLRKLTDIYIGSNDWKLFLDSDMLFFKNPEFLINWLKNPEYPCYMIDVKDSYGYSFKQMEIITNQKIPNLVNIGIMGFKSDDIDWYILEKWLKYLIENYGPRYNITQALSAMLIAGNSSSVAPKEDYIVLPDQSESKEPTAVMHHYVAESKPWYFQYAWKHIIEKRLNDDYYKKNIK